MQYKILIAGGDSPERDDLRDIASHHGFTVMACSKGSEAMEQVKRDGADLVMLAGDLPDMNLSSWLGIFRQTDWGHNVAVVVLGAQPSEAEIVVAFESGADDFIKSPCDPAELGARLRAVLRRRYEREQFLGQPLSGGPIVLDPSRHECLVRGQIKRLRRREFELLEVLMRKSGRILNRAYLLDAVWGMSRDADTRAVDVAVSRLRQMLGRRAGRYIETWPGFGYRFNPGVRSEP